MDSREGSPEESVSKSDEKEGDGTIGRTWKPLPKHLGRETRPLWQEPSSKLASMVCLPVFGLSP